MYLLKIIKEYSIRDSLNHDIYSMKQTIYSMKQTICSMKHTVN